MRTSRWVAVAFWVAFGIIMVLDVAYTPGFGESGLAFAQSLYLALLMFGWYLADSNENEVPRSMGLNIAVILIGFIALPYYRFRYFGARRGFIFLATLIAAFIGTLILVSVLMAAIYGGPVF